jgi:hypothetical protein
MPLEKLLGANYPAVASPKLIEGQVVELEPEPIAAGQPESQQLDQSGKNGGYLSPDFD